MSRRVLAVGFSVLFLAVTIWLAGRPLKPAAAAPEQVPVRGESEFPHFVVFPYLQYATADSITIVLGDELPRLVGGALRHRHAGLAQGRAEGRDPPRGHADGPEAGGGSRLPGDDRGREDKVTSPLLTFQTAVGADEAFSFVVIGDTQKNPTMTAKVAKLMWRAAAELRRALRRRGGQRAGQGASGSSELFGPCNELFARVPVFPCIGNHEKNHAHYYKYFALPEPEYYYRYRYGNADFFVARHATRRSDPDSEQYKWLDAELAQVDAKWKFVLPPPPGVLVGRRRLRRHLEGASAEAGDLNVRNLVALYEKHKVDVVFNGHIHLYERTWPIRDGQGGPEERACVYVTSRRRRREAGGLRADADVVQGAVPGRTTTSAT